jgi:hypothetical protein
MITLFSPSPDCVYLICPDWISKQSVRNLGDLNTDIEKLSSLWIS